MRENDFRLDKILLVKDSAYVPSALGPSQSSCYESVVTVDVCGDGVCSVAERSVCVLDCSRILGNVSDFAGNLVGPVLRVDGGDGFYSYRDSVSPLEVVESGVGGVVRVSLNFVFDKPLNLSRLKFLKQGAADTRGYFLVKGLSLVSETKSVLVNRVNGSSVVCVKDAEVDSIGEVSAGCNGVDEYLVGCDGSVTSDGYRCVIRDAYFNVSGLHHSAVAEMGS